MFRASYKYPAFLLVLVNLLAFGLLYAFGKSGVVSVYIMGGTLLLFIIMYSLIIYFKMGDKYVMLIAAMLVTFGVLMLCRIDTLIGTRQIIWVLAGVIVFFGVYFIYKNIGFWSSLWYIYVALAFLLFLVTLAAGKEIGGSKNWIIIGNFSVQPSEVMKILFIIFLACYYCGKFEINYFKIPSKYYSMAVVYVFIGFMIIQREWGTALLFFLIYFFMMYVFEKDWKILASNAVIAVVGGVLGYKFMYHIQIRVSTWLNPWDDIAHTGYQITQSLFAIANGGYFGTGIGNGAPMYIPEVHSDFIFAAICEEMGIFGGVAVILLFFILTYRCFKIALDTKDIFNKAVVLGISIMYGFQTFIIIGGVIKFIPLTGITLPFISYGGSSMVVSFAALGIVQSISAEQRGN